MSSYHQLDSSPGRPECRMHETQTSRQSPLSLASYPRPAKNGFEAQRAAAAEPRVSCGAACPRAERRLRSGCFRKLALGKTFSKRRRPVPRGGLAVEPVSSCGFEVGLEATHRWSRNRLYVEWLNLAVRKREHGKCGGDARSLPLGGAARPD